MPGVFRPYTLADVLGVDSRPGGPAGRRHHRLRGRLLRRGRRDRGLADTATATAQATPAWDGGEWGAVHVGLSSRRRHRSRRRPARRSSVDAALTARVREHAAPGRNVICTNGLTAFAAALVWAGIQDQAANLGVTTPTYLTPLYGAVGSGSGTPAEVRHGAVQRAGRETVGAGASSPATSSIAARGDVAVLLPAARELVDGDGGRAVRQRDRRGRVGHDGRPLGVLAHR